LLFFSLGKRILGTATCFRRTKGQRQEDRRGRENFASEAVSRLWSTVQLSEPQQRRQISAGKEDAAVWKLPGQQGKKVSAPKLGE
jgi:hypothetical protein